MSIKKLSLKKIKTLKAGNGDLRCTASNFRGANAPGQIQKCE